jgi:hypothetical protein
MQRALFWRNGPIMDARRDWANVRRVRWGGILNREPSLLILFIAICHNAAEIAP